MLGLGGWTCLTAATLSSCEATPRARTAQAQQARHGHQVYQSSSVRTKTVRDFFRTLHEPRVMSLGLRRTVLRRVLAQAQIQRVLNEARKYHIIGSTHVSCKAAAILRCASNAGRAHLYYLHKSSSKCNQTSTSRGRTSQSCATREPKYYYYSPLPPRQI